MIMSASKRQLWELQAMLRKLKKSGPWMTRQQYRTIKGQILAGDYEGAEKGLNKILNAKRGKNHVQSDDQKPGPIQRL